MGSVTTPTLVDGGRAREALVPTTGTSGPLFHGAARSGFGGPTPVRSVRSSEAAE